MSQLARRKCADARAGAAAVKYGKSTHTFGETAPLRAPDGGALPNESGGCAPGITVSDIYSPGPPGTSSH